MEHTAPVVLAAVLRKTSLNEALVLASLGAAFAVVIPGLYRKVRVAAHNKAFWGIVAGILVASVWIFIASPTTFDSLCGESHIIEWLTAHMLLIAGVVGIMAMLRLRARRAHFPLTVFLTTGCLVAFCRELQWGEPFFGEKIIYTRYLFRPKAYFDASHFDGLAEDVGMSQEFLHRSFLVFMVLMIVVGAVTISYIVRHRKLFAKELQAFCKHPAGRFFMAGCGLYLLSQLTGEIVEDAFKAQLTAAGMSHCVVAEPLELIASMLLARAMVRVWHMQRCYLPAAVLRERAVAASAIPACRRRALRPQHTGAPG
jgi:hypothetical protein